MCCGLSCGVYLLQKFTTDAVISEFTRKGLAISASLVSLALVLDGLHIFYHSVYGKLIVKDSEASGLAQFGLLKVSLAQLDGDLTTI